MNDNNNKNSNKRPKRREKSNSKKLKKRNPDENRLGIKGWNCSASVRWFGSPLQHKLLSPSLSVRGKSCLRGIRVGLSQVFLTKTVIANSAAGFWSGAHRENYSFVDGNICTGF